MALRKEDTEYSQAHPPTEGSRITIDVSPQLRHRIQLAAVEHDLSIGEYLEEILEQAVPAEVSKIPRQRQPITRKTLEHVFHVREQIMEHTKGYLFEDSTEIVRQMREERSQELEQL